MNTNRIQPVDTPRHGKAWRLAFAALLICTVLAAPLVHAAPEQRFAWVDQGKAKSGAFVVHRAGKAVPYTDEGLLRCDVVKWTDTTKAVLVRLSNGRQFLFSDAAAGREFKVPCDQPGITAQLMAALSGFVGDGDKAAVKAASMSTRGDVLLAARLLNAAHPELLAGKRALYVRWTGGEGPFELTLSDKSTGKVIARRSGITSREATLPEVDLRPGAYRLEIQQPKGPTGYLLKEEALVVVDGSSLPAMPAALKEAELPSDVKEVFYAGYLASKDDGRWKLEAAQQMARIAERSAAARDWLNVAAGELDAARKP